jgi:hypothetical protein
MEPLIPLALASGPARTAAQNAAADIIGIALMACVIFLFCSSFQFSSLDFKFMSLHGFIHFPAAQ